MDDSIFLDHSATVVEVSRLYGEIKRTTKTGYKLLEEYVDIRNSGREELRCKLIAMCRADAVIRKGLVMEMQRILDSVDETQ